MSAFDLIPFDPANESHRSFIFDTFRRSTGHWPWSEMHRPRLQERLRHELASPGTDTCLAVPHGMPDDFLGWYSVRKPNVIVYGFTKYSMRRQGVATRALAEMGVELQPARNCMPTWLVFWTPAAARIGGNGRLLMFDLREAFNWAA